MPADFERCRKRGGKVRTITPDHPLGRKHHLKKGQYMTYCFLGKKSYPGEIHSKTAEALKGGSRGS